MRNAGLACVILGRMKTLALAFAVMGFTACATTHPTREENECIGRRRALFESFSARPIFYRDFVKALDGLKFPAIEVRYQCHNGNTEPSEDLAALPLILHEGVHHLSNQPVVSAPVTYEYAHAGYGYYQVETVSVVKLHFIKTLPDLMHTFGGKEPFVGLGKYKQYVPRFQEWKVYDLLNEWNAYSSELSVLADVRARTGCTGIKRSDEGEGSESFLVLTHGYLKRLKTHEPADFKKLSADPNFAPLISTLLKRTETGLAETKKYPCLFGMEEKRGLRPLVQAAKADLNTWFKK